MSEIVKLEDLQDRIIELRGQSVLLDADVAEIYGVETKRIKEARADYKAGRVKDHKEVFGQ